jgi:LacI family transcriptional regulator
VRFTVKISIYDIAREANVSIATVSRVLNNKSVVAPETRFKVEETIKRMNYRPSAIARGLVLKHTLTIGILTINICSPHHTKTAYTIERELFKLGYSSILCNTGGSLDSNVEYLHMLVGKGVSGIMCIGSVFRNTFEETSVLSELPHIPFIFGNCVLSADNAYAVTVDEFHTLKMCVDHLKLKGHKDIFYVKDTDSYGGNEKVRNFLLNMHISDLPADESSIITSDRSVEGGIKAVDRIVESGKPFSAIIFGDDITAAGGLKRLKQLGYSVPRDVAIIGCNNAPVSVCCDPPLTTIDHKPEIIGGLMVKLLEMITSGQNTSHLLTVTPELIVREST